jgi:chitin disaccharide deacetylase
VTREALVVINADDLGLSVDTNHAVLQALECGWVSSATLMANMPGFDEACEMVLQKGLGDRIGLHLNLTQGMPLSDPIRYRPRLSRPDGTLGLSRSIWPLRKAEVEAIDAEASAQVEALISQGIRPSHMDSHHHIHTIWSVSSILIGVARRYEIPAIRPARNCGRSSSPLRQAYKAAFNRRLTVAGLAPARHFGSDPDTAALGRIFEPLEIMVHPALVEGRVVDGAHGRQLEEIAAEWRSKGRLLSYRELVQIGSMAHSKRIREGRG